MPLQIECYRATVTEKFKKFEELSYNDRLSVYPLPLSSKTFNICMEVEWETEGKTPCGSGFKYLLITPKNLHNFVTNVIVGYDPALNKISVVRIIGNIYDAVKTVYPDFPAELPYPPEMGVNEHPLIPLLLDEVIRSDPQKQTIIHYH